MVDASIVGAQACAAAAVPCAGAVSAEQAVNALFCEQGNWELEVGAHRFPAAVSLKPMYDPTNLRIRA